MTSPFVAVSFSISEQRKGAAGMKKLLVALAIASIVASPALADNDGPSKKDTIEWIESKIDFMNAVYRKNGIPSGSTIQKLYFYEANGSLDVSRIERDENARYSELWFSVVIARLSTKVEVESHGDDYNEVKLVCTSPGCVTVTNMNDKSEYTRNHMWVIVPSGDMADRLAKAFEHLIRIYGV